MNATEYMVHWSTKKVWNNLLSAKHQARLRRCAELTFGGEVVDVGCAYGHSTDHMAHFRPAKWAGMDFDEGAVGEARKLFPQYEFFFSGDYDMFAATSGRTFDSVVCSEVIEHVPEDALFIQGLVKLARRRIVVTTPNVRVKDPGHLRCHTTESLNKLFAGHRFRILSEGRFFYVVIDLPNGGPK